MLNLEIKKEWIAALRSDDYQQGEAQLKTEDGKFCCLGVLCDILQKKGVVTEFVSENTTSFYGLVNEPVGDYEVLSVGISLYLGINCNPEMQHIVKGETVYDTLSELNDNGMSFNDIATLIEKQL